MFVVAPHSWYPAFGSSGWCWWWCSVLVDLVGLILDGGSTLDQLASEQLCEAFSLCLLPVLWYLCLLHTPQNNGLPFNVCENYWQGSMWKYEKTCFLLFGCKKTCLMSNEKPADTHTGVLAAKAQPNAHAQWSPIASHHFISLPLLSRPSLISLWQLLLFSVTFPPVVFQSPSITWLCVELDY